MIKRFERLADNYLTHFRNGIDSLENRYFFLAILLVAGLWVALAGSINLIVHYLYAILDDARHFIVWLRSYENSELFVDDSVAEFFKSATPFLYKFLYAPAIIAGIDPLIWRAAIIMPAAVLLAVAGF